MKYPPLTKNKRNVFTIYLLTIFFKDIYMYKILCILTLSSSCFAATTADHIPTLEEIKTTDHPSGLNLELLEKRGAMIRKNGSITENGKTTRGGEDFSSYVSVYQVAKNKISKCTRALIKVRSEIETAQKKRFNKKNLEKLKTEETRILDKIKYLQTGTKGGVQKILEMTGITSIQLAKIPKRASRADKADPNDASCG